MHRLQWMSLLSKMLIAAGRHDDIDMVIVVAVGCSLVPLRLCEIHLPCSSSNIVNILLVWGVWCPCHSPPSEWWGVHCPRVFLRRLLVMTEWVSAAVHGFRAFAEGSSCLNGIE